MDQSESRWVGFLPWTIWNFFYRPPTQNLVALGPWEPKLLSKTHAFTVCQGCYSATYGRIVPNISGGLSSPPLHDFTKFRDNPLSSVCVTVHCFWSGVIAPPMGRAGSKRQAFFLVPPYITLPSLVEIGAIILKLSCFQTDTCTCTRYRRSCGTVALEAEVNISKYQRMREVSVRQLWDIYNQK